MIILINIGDVRVDMFSHGLHINVKRSLVGKDRNLASVPESESVKVSTLT